MIAMVINRVSPIQAMQPAVLADEVRLLLHGPALDVLAVPGVLALNFLEKNQVGIQLVNDFLDFMQYESSVPGAESLVDIVGQQFQLRRGCLPHLPAVSHFFGRFF